MLFMVPLGPPSARPMAQALRLPFEYYYRYLDKGFVEFTKVHSCSVGPRKLCGGVKYYIVHMYSMPYYTNGSTAVTF